MGPRKLYSIVDQVYEQLHADILTGTIAPGARLVELELGERYGTSQGTIRSALQKLETDGLVDRRARTGTFVTPIDIRQMKEIFQVRAFLEGVAIRRGVSVLSPGGLNELRSALREMASASQQSGMIGLVRADKNFHRMICGLADNKPLLRSWEILYNQVQRFIAQTHGSYFASLEEIVASHQPILDAVEAKDGARAATVLSAHIMQIWDLIEAEQADAARRQA